MSHSSGSFRPIRGFLESAMSVAIYVSTQTTAPLHFQRKRKAEEESGERVVGGKMVRRGKGKGER